MNAQIPDYSAVYAANPGSCAPCQQAKAAAYRNHTGAAAEKREAPAAGDYAGVPQQMAGLPAAMRQPAIAGAVQGMQAAQPATPATTGQLMPITDQTQPAPMTAESVEFLNGFLRTQIGRRVRVEFLVGTNTFTDKAGTLLGVGANYILLREANTDDIMACDFFNIKFVTFFY